jgi:hypothetical protein
VLPSYAELRALEACFEVYAEADPNVTNDQWDAVVALIKAAD